MTAVGEYSCVPIKERLAERTREVEGCHVFTGARKGNGYGEIMHEGRRRGAHVVSYEATYGPVPEGLFVCHHCDNPPCINPDHLFVGTNSDNQLDASSKGRGSRNNLNGAKLTASQVEQIRLRLADGDLQRIVAADMGVTQSCISMIVTGKHWGKAA